MPRINRKIRRSGYNRRTSSKKSGGRAGIVWFLILIVGLGFMAFLAPVGGKTVAGRVGDFFGTEIVKVGTGIKNLVELKSPTSDKKVEKPIDKLTERDKRELNDLITKKTKN